MKIVVTLFCLLLFTLIASAQIYQQHFQIYPVTHKIKFAFYKRIYLYDARNDTSHLGELQQGINDNLVHVVAKPALRIQLQNLVDSLTDYTAKDGDLLFHLRQFRLSESSGVFREKGYFSMRAAIYARISGSYRKIRTIDTFIVVKSSEAANALFKKVSSVVTGFVEQSLSRIPSDTTRYSAPDIKNLEQFEKNQTPLYFNQVLNDGLYKTYKSFMAQKPDAKVTATLSTNELKSVKVLDTDGKTSKLSSGEIYAVVYNGKPFISTESGYCLMEKRGSDFYFTTKIKPTSNGGEVARAQLWFGLTGAIIAANEKGLFEVKLDHYNGSFIPVKRIRALENDH